MSESSKHRNALAPVAAEAVVIVTVLPDPATEAIVGVPVPGPFRSALQKLFAAETAAALVKVNPSGKVRTTCPPEGTEVVARKFTMYLEVAPAPRLIGVTLVGFIPCAPGSMVPVPGPIMPPPEEDCTVANCTLPAGVPVVSITLLERSCTTGATVTLKVLPFVRESPVMRAVLVPAS